jgi:plastocyanin
VRTPNATKALVAGFAAVLIAAPRAAWAVESSEVEELRREVHQLQAQVQTLRQAISEAADLQRQQAALFSKALKGLGNAPSESKGEAPPSRASATAANPPPLSRSEIIREGSSGRRSAGRAERAERAERVERVESAEPVPGTIRGKIAVPSGEPVAYVYVENVLAPPVKGQRKVIEQAGKKFVPGWAVVQRGTAIAFPNTDNIYHNVFSLSPGNQFDLGLYNSGGEPKAHTFSESGPVDVYCNIHPQMAASVLVVPNKYFAKVKADGSYEIPGVPAGRRKVVAWAPGSRPATEWIEVAAGGDASVNLKLESKAPSHKNKAGQAYGSYE